MKKFILVAISICLSCLAYSQYPYKYYNPKYYDQLNNKTFSNLLLEDTSGVVFNTSVLKGKTIYVDFWFTACAPCIKEIPYSKSLQEYFAADTNIVFVNICIENFQRKQNWKQLVRDKKMTGINLFYPLNRPQKVNLLREYRIELPTYILVDSTMKVTGYDVPRPSEEGLVHWVLAEALKGRTLAEAMKPVNKSKEYFVFIKQALEQTRKFQP